VCDILDARPSRHTDCRATSGELEYRVSVCTDSGVRSDVWATQAWLDLCETHSAWERYRKSASFTRQVHAGKRGDRVSAVQLEERGPGTVLEWRYPNGAPLG